MKLINTDTQYDCYIDYFQEIEVRIKKDKTTNQIYFSSDSAAKVLGFNNTDDMIQSNSDVTNALLDGMNKGLVVKTFNNNTDREKEYYCTIALHILFAFGTKKT